MSFPNDTRQYTLLIRAFAALMVCMVLLFLLNNYLVFVLGWPTFTQSLTSLSPFTHNSEIGPEQVSIGWIQCMLYLVIIVLVITFVKKTPARSLDNDADLYSRFAAFIIRASFWAVLLIGLVDMLISFLRVEGFLAGLIGHDLTTQLGRPIYRGLHIHYPLMGLAIIIAFFSRTLGFTWLAFLVVLAEFQIVVTRFVFSYEQAFMGDLVRFWYAALFLFASAYTLVHEGHVRVDVLYTNFTKRNKALSNIFGSILLGLPLCWTILIQGMSGKGSSINSPLLSFEISQSGFGMYVKYLMAGFLLIFAVSMAIQFVSWFLSNLATLQSNNEAKTS